MGTNAIDADMRLLDVGDVRCACGLVFRYALTEGGATFWPQNTVWGFRATPVDGDECISCSTPLTGLVQRGSGPEPAA